MLGVFLRHFRSPCSLSYVHFATARKSIFCSSLHPLGALSTGVSGNNMDETAIDVGAGGGYDDGKFPQGGFVWKRPTVWKSFMLRTRLFFAMPWARFEKGSVLKMTLRGEITDQLKTFSRVLSLPQICENFEKAAYDPRIAGIYLHIDELQCGWGKLEEIRRHVLDFKRSGKFIIGYAQSCGVKEYYIGSACEELYAPPSAYIGLYGMHAQGSFLGGMLEKIGVEAEVQRIGRFKTAADSFTRKTMSDEGRETLRKKKTEIENFLNEGAHQVERMKEEGLITDIIYDDEVISLLKKRLGRPESKGIPTVDYSKYCNVSRRMLGLSSNEHQIAIIRASGGIRRTQGQLRTSSTGIFADRFIEKIRHLRVSKKYKAVIIRIDSPGGDALASDLIWREIKLLAASKPVIASMSDIAASGGYYIAMAAGAIVAEKLTLTGSIGVVTGKLNLQKLYEYIGFNKEIISRGRYAEFATSEHRPLRADEAELFAKKAQDIYNQFRNKAALSRSMTVENMEKVAQGRVWSGCDAASLGLVDAIGGISRAVAIAKQMANIPQDKQVTLVELSRSPPNPFDILRAIGNTLAEADEMVGELLTQDDEIQARIDDTLYQNVDGASNTKPALSLIKDCLRWL